jgi:hypothetical protein
MSIYNKKINNYYLGKNEIKLKNKIGNYKKIKINLII